MSVTWAYRTGQSATTIWTPDKVAACPDPAIAFAQYVRQTMGTPAPTAKDVVVLRTKVKAIFAEYPRADWYTMCRIVAWSMARKKRYSRVFQVAENFRQAWAEGMLPELDSHRREDDVEARISRALNSETDPMWRRRLVGATGIEARRLAITEWERSASAKA